MKHSTLLASLAVLVTTFAANAWETGQELSEVLFEGVDSTGNGILDFGEIHQMSEDIAFSVDSDGDQLITLDEFRTYDFGFAYLAEAEGESETFSAVERVMFAVADLDANGAIDEREWRLSSRWSFERADLDGNAVLTKQEFLNGWTPIVMLKAGRSS